MAEISTLYRLIILYMLDKVDYPLTNTQIANFMLENDYTTYFTIQETISDLLDSDFIVAESTHSNTNYRITEEGRQTLSYFSDKISDAIKSDFAAYVKKNELDLKVETAVIADYYKTTTGDYAAHCQIRDGKRTVIDLTIGVSNKEQAIAVCTNWSDKSEDVFELLMDQLMQ